MCIHSISWKVFKVWSFWIIYWASSTKLENHLKIFHHKPVRIKWDELASLGHFGFFCFYASTTKIMALLFQGIIKWNTCSENVNNINQNLELSWAMFLIWCEFIFGPHYYFDSDTNAYISLISFFGHNKPSSGRCDHSATKTDIILLLC